MGPSGTPPTAPPDAVELPCPSKGGAGETPSPTGEGVLLGNSAAGPCPPSGEPRGGDAEVGESAIEAGVGCWTVGGRAAGPPLRRGPFGRASRDGPRRRSTGGGGAWETRPSLPPTAISETSPASVIGEGGGGRQDCRYGREGSNWSSSSSSRRHDSARSERRREDSREGFLPKVAPSSRGRWELGIPAPRRASRVTCSSRVVGVV